jgi:hypothetical protein
MLASPTFAAFAIALITYATLPISTIFVSIRFADSPAPFSRLPASGGRPIYKSFSRSPCVMSFRSCTSSMAYLTFPDPISRSP